MRKKLLDRDEFIKFWQSKISDSEGISKPFSKLREEIPAVFAGTRLDTYTGFGYRWRTLQNEKSRGEVPNGVFIEGE